MIASAQQITRAPLAHRNEFGKDGLCLKAAQAQSAKKPAQGVAPLKTRGFASELSIMVFKPMMESSM